MIDATVVMCVRNGAAVVGSQLEALAAQQCSQSWELVVVDNGSTDETVEVVRQWQSRVPMLRVVEASERAGLAYARNVGAAAAAGHVLTFCDADDIADRRWLATLIEGALSADIVGGRLELELLNGETVRYWRGLSEDDLCRPQALGYLRYAVGANFAVRRATYQSVGGCDEAFVTCGDDIDLSWRVQRAGGTLAFRSDAIMHYRLRADLRGLMRQRYLYGRAEGLLRRKFADSVPPLRWQAAWPAYRHLLTRSWHVAADDRRRGLWLGVASYCAGRLAER